MTHIWVSRLTITGSDNGLLPGRHQAIIWTNAEIFLIGPFRTNFSENLIEILTFSFTKMRLKVSSAKWRPFCLGHFVSASMCQLGPSSGNIPEGNAKLYKRYMSLLCFDILKLRQNGRHFSDNILKCIFLYENVWISIKIPLKFVPKGPNNNIPALVQIMAWCQPGNKP